MKAVNTPLGLRSHSVPMKVSSALCSAPNSGLSSLPRRFNHLQLTNNLERMGLYPTTKVHLCIPHSLKFVSCCVHCLLNGSAPLPSDSSQMMELSLSHPFLRFPNSVYLEALQKSPRHTLNSPLGHLLLPSTPTWKTAAS